MYVFFSFFSFNHHDEKFIEKEKQKIERERKRERKREFVKQNSEAQIEWNEQTTTKQKFIFFIRIQYHRQYSCLTYIHMSRNMFFNLQYKEERDLSFDNGRKTKQLIDQRNKERKREEKNK